MHGSYDFCGNDSFSCGRVNRSKAKQLNSNRKQIILTKLICNQPSSVRVYTVKLPVKTDEGSKDTHFYRFIIPMKSNKELMQILRFY